MTIAIGADHAGFELKQWLLAELRREGFDLTDHGTHDTTPCDYPDIAGSVGHAVADGAAGRGIIICGSGVGASIAANKITGVRAAVCHDLYSGHQGVEHDDMNVLCLGARVIGREQALEIARAFLQARFSAEERHVRRLEKVLEMEKNRS